MSQCKIRIEQNQTKLSDISSLLRRNIRSQTQFLLLNAQELQLLVVNCIGDVFLFRLSQLLNLKG